MGVSGDLAAKEACFVVDHGLSAGARRQTHIGEASWLRAVAPQAGKPAGLALRVGSAYYSQINSTYLY